MNIKDWQKTVDEWIKDFGVRYFDEKTNTLLLVEEVGEFSRLIARKYGEQSFKNETQKNQVNQDIKEEIADIFFVLTCLSNQMDIDITEILQDTIDKKTKRDFKRHKDNEKLH